MLPRSLCQISTVYAAVTELVRSRFSFSVSRVYDSYPMLLLIVTATELMAVPTVLALQEQYFVARTTAVRVLADDAAAGEVVKATEPSQSLPVCIAFAAASGLLRVCATMVLAYPDYLEKKQQQQQQQQQHRSEPDIATNNDDSDDNNGASGSGSNSSKVKFIAAHLLILLIAAILSIVSTIYGPVSISVPIQTGSCLLFNVAAMGILLKMRAFNKAQRTGTYIVFLSILSLVDVGPGVQEGQDALQLLSAPAAIFWTLLITFLIVFAGVGTILLITTGSDSAASISPLTHWFQSNATLILAIGVTMSNVGMATASKTFASLRGGSFLAAFLYYLFTTILGVLFSVVSSTACDQGVFTPLSSVALIITNMVTGIVIWEDWKVIDTWVAYVCACFLMVCGVYLLAEIDLIEKYGRKALTNVVMQRRPSLTVSSSDMNYGSLLHVVEMESTSSPATEAWEATLTSSVRER